MHTQPGNDNWVQVELKAPAKVKSILIVNREGNGPYVERINPSDIRVGNDPDVTKNPSCGVTVTAPGIFKCNLAGKYIGLI